MSDTGLEGFSTQVRRRHRGILLESLGHATGINTFSRFIVGPILKSSGNIRNFGMLKEILAWQEITEI
jgi:hypothetical protein